MQGAATVDDRPTTSGDDDDRIVMVKLLIALASLEPNDKRLNLWSNLILKTPLELQHAFGVLDTA